MCPAASVAKLIASRQGAMMMLVMSNGRTMKFTPERLEQIKNLVERGKKREEIAEIIGVTLGSLQVTCSRLGISLRPPRFHVINGAPKPPEQPRQIAATMQNSQPLERPTLAIGTRYRGQERMIDVPLNSEMMGQLALEAQLRGVTIGELVIEVIVAVLKKDFFETVLRK